MRLRQRLHMQPVLQYMYALVQPVLQYMHALVQPVLHAVHACTRAACAAMSCVNSTPSHA